MQVKFLLRLFGIFICSVNIAKGSSYADEVKTLLRKHFNNENNICWSTATLKANQYKGDENKSMAITLINVYTQECYQYNDNTNVWPFYRALNTKLRAKTSENIWLDTESLLNQGLEMIGLDTWDLLYRSCFCNNIKKGSTIIVDDFWSTSLEARASNNFLNKDKIFFQIVDARRGANIRNYSTYSGEKEILLQSKSEFYVTEYFTDATGIKNKKEGVNESGIVWNDMKAFAVVTSNIPTRAVRSVSNYCDCLAGTTSDASMPARRSSALFVIVFMIVRYMRTK
ncbi:uncharacterized protein LOC128206359 [Mya arenaria]|uniref:uncharacterized protein LOC128206359 n=1 Tax=Mya arenaria TaxID=6604 RepID=UPI0022E10E4E|nr:uncharacterized protein LOC128206359 [Mya arenaria]